MLMERKQPTPARATSADHHPDRRFSRLARKLLSGASRGLSRNTFFKSMLRLLHDDISCDSVELRLVDLGRLQLCRFTPDADKPFILQIIPPQTDYSEQVIPILNEGSDHERLCRSVIDGRLEPGLTGVTEQGSFWTGNTYQTINVPDPTGENKAVPLYVGGAFKSLVIIPFSFENENRGLLLLKAKNRDAFTAEEVAYAEETAQILAIAVAHWRTQVALRERVKELTCLCGIAKIVGRPDISLPDIFHETVGLLPAAWLFPDIATARITFDGQEYATPGFRSGLQSLTADIIVNGNKRGAIEVAYVRKVRDYDEGPFLKEERSLIDAMADEISLMVQRREAEEEKDRLEEQLRHADRLATIGQLAAGVAHELNEPLANILGFAQLAARNPDKSDDIGQDIDKIIGASLHARTIIDRLRLFARQTPQKKGNVDMNRVINDGLYFLESRCAKAGIELIRILSPDLPQIAADRGQMYQIMVNLVVNAIQAMPDGGTLTIRTVGGKEDIAFIVEDTGVGMDDEVLNKIFVPFFTTKDVNEGTGLGLAVVHGIVSSHGGHIDVESRKGEGSRFEVRLPLEA